MVKGSKIVVIGATADGAKRSLWAQLREKVATSRIPIGSFPGDSKWTLGNNWFVELVSPDKPESIHGVHGRGVVVVVDEASKLKAEIWPAVDSLLASEGAKCIVFFNPLAAEHKTREIVDNPRWRGVTLSCEDHPNVVQRSNIIDGAVTWQWVEDRKEDVRAGRMSQGQYDARVRGEFPAGAADALLDAQDLERSLTAAADDVPRLGLDVARFGNDRSVLVYVDGKRRASVVEEWSGKDLMWTAGRLLRAVRELGVSPRMTFVDSCGVGGGVVDRCREAGVHVVGVDAGEKATGRWASVVGRETTFVNRRAEMYWTLRCICKSFAVSIPRDMWSDLGMIRTGYRGSDVLIRSKDDMRKEHGRSPDRADALALCFADPSASFALEMW